MEKESQKLEQVSLRAGKGYDNIDQMYKTFSSDRTNIEVPKCFNYYHRFNGIFSRDSLPRIEDETYAINLNDKKGKVTHRILLFHYKEY